MKNRIKRKYTLVYNYPLAKVKTNFKLFFRRNFSIEMLIEYIVIIIVLICWTSLILENNFQNTHSTYTKGSTISLTSIVEEKSQEIFSNTSSEESNKDVKDTIRIKEISEIEKENSVRNEESAHKEEETIVKKTNKIKVNAYKIKGIKGIYQLPQLPTGCEATALTTLMNFKGIKADKYEIAMDYMPRKELYFEDKVLYGPNPVSTFVGNPSEDSGLGCFAPCLVRTFKSFQKKHTDVKEKYQAVDLTGSDFEILLQDYVVKDIPIVVIVSQFMWKPHEGTTWQLKSGGTWTWMVNHHAMVVYGFDLSKNEVYVCDSLQQSGIATYDLQRFEEIYNLKGKSAMTILEKF